MLKDGEEKTIYCSCGDESIGTITVNVSGYVGKVLTNKEIEKNLCEKCLTEAFAKLTILRNNRKKHFETCKCAQCEETLNGREE